MKTSIFSAGLLLAATVLLLSLSVSAQTMFGYQVLVDADADAATGCSVTPTGGAALAGFEHRLLIDVEVAGGSAEVIALERQDCSGGNFSAPVAVTSPASPPWPVGLNLGAGGADAVEAGVLREAVGAAFSAQVRLAFVADDGTGSDVLATTDGSASGEAILLGLPLDPVQIPLFSLWGIVLLLLAVVVLGWLAQRKLGRIGAMSVVLLIAGLAWAMNFMLDGAVSDWTGIAPASQDPTGDATDGNSGNDLVAGFAAFENGALYFRIDVVDMENQAPVAADDAYSTDEDTPLNIAAPGVLANDTDGDMDPLTATLVTGPANAQSFMLNPDGSFDYAPSADFNGSDSFTYFANDGQADSSPVTVAITIDPVNDAPSFSAGGDVTYTGASSAQVVAGWATAISAGPTNEGGQTLNFNVTGNTNAAIFDVPPTVDATTGDLSYTPASGAFGLATVTLVLEDSGGTANGGSDTSAPVAFDISINPDANAVDDSTAVAVGSAAQIDVLANDTGVGLQAISFGDSLANVGTAPADGATTLSFVVGGGLIDVTLDGAGNLGIDASTATGGGTITLFYAISASNGTTDTGQISISYGDFPFAGDDTQINGVSFITPVNTTFDSESPGYQSLLTNDTLGTPAAALVSFGGGDLGGDSTSFTAPGTTTLAGVGTLTLTDNAGNFEFVPALGFSGGFVFEYRIENGVGFSDAMVEISVE